MSVLKKSERKEIIEEICGRFNKKGISRLEEKGQYSKYTALYHFTIQEPSKEWPFIFITELFGNERYENRASPFLVKEGMRAQYHGDYDGLHSIVMQGITKDMIVSNKYGSGRKFFPPFCEIASKPNLLKEDQLAFDNALIYIRDVLQYLDPDSIKSDFTFETFLDTFNKP
jgi:hypothetical protein